MPATDRAEARARADRAGSGRVLYASHVRTQDRPQQFLETALEYGRVLEHQAAADRLARHCGGLAGGSTGAFALGMGVELTGLAALNGRHLVLLYGSETANVEHDGFVTRLRPYEVKVFATSRDWETKNVAGRDFGFRRPAAD